MAVKENRIDKDNPFRERFWEQYRKTNVTQDKLAKALGVSRPTVAGWLNGDATPNIMVLKKLAQHFGVSADYLLGLSDTEKPDVTLRAAMEYTGLSEAAVERLHIGLDDFTCDGVGVSNMEKKRNLRTASELIKSEAFLKMVKNLNDVVREAYYERILKILYERYTVEESLEEDSELHYESEEARNAVVTNLRYVFNLKLPTWEEYTAKLPEEMDDEELTSEVVQALLSARDTNELRQFHASKAFTGYIDQLARDGARRAELRFEKK